ncbi:MAG: PIN domain-containing protein [Gammaproteobacteria bacterium]
MSVEFIDTNVLIYLFDETDERKRTIAERLVESAMQTQDACISYQVVQETLNVVTRKLASPMSADGARGFLERVLMPLCRVMPSRQLYQRGLDIQARCRYSFYDALIIASALEIGCGRLNSEDLQHGQRIEGLTIHNPFAATA